VAELPTCQNTLLLILPFVRMIDDDESVVRVDEIWNTHASSAGFWVPSSVSATALSAAELANAYTPGARTRPPRLVPLRSTLQGRPASRL
jgi:hypothetical protein